MHKSIKEGEGGGQEVSGQMSLSDRKWIFGRPLNMVQHVSQSCLCTAIFNKGLCRFPLTIRSISVESGVKQ